MCTQQGKSIAATVVDHVVPHRGDMALFWDPKNRQSLCDTCHNSHKQRLEKSGTVSGCDLDGLPIDPNHPGHAENQVGGG
jgi:5-methylcytosine-specific restriction protein A